MGNSVFQECYGLDSIILPNSLTEIGGMAFGFCSGLKTVTIPNSVIKMGGGSFRGCHGLSSVVISAGIDVFHNTTFLGCENLRFIYNLNPNPQTIEVDVFKNVPLDATVYIPKGSMTAYAVADEWSKFTDFREMGALEISLSDTTLALSEGETATLTATVLKDEDMTVTSEEWSSSNPEVATVENGLVTAVGDGEAKIYYTVVDGYGVPHTETCVVTVGDPGSVSDILGDSDAMVDVFTMQGTAVLLDAPASGLDILPAGLYIVRQGKTAKKIIVK